MFQDALMHLFAPYETTGIRIVNSQDTRRGYSVYLSTLYLTNLITGFQRIIENKEFIFFAFLCPGVYKMWKMCWKTYYIRNKLM